MTSVLKLVFSNPLFLLISIVIFLGLLFPLLIISEYIFLEPYIIGHIPKDTEFGFSLIVILSALSGLVMSMNIYRVKILKSSSRKMSGGVFGSFIGAVAGACSCGPVGFAVISTFGTIGATASTFLTNYEIPIRVAAIGILCFTYWTTTKSLQTECNL